MSNRPIPLRERYGMNAPSAAALFDLTGQSPLVTGSSKGIGLALARGLAKPAPQSSSTPAETTHLRQQPLRSAPKVTMSTTVRSMCAIRPLSVEPWNRSRMRSGPSTCS